MLRRALLAALCLASAAGTALAQSNDPSFRIVNNTPNTVNEVYASPSSERSWGHDRLGTSVIAPGGTHIVRLPANGQCVYDIRIVYQNNTAEERRNLNTCALTDVVLGGNTGPGPQQQARPPRGGGEQGNPSFYLLNQTGRVIEEFYASPSSQSNWGPDRLGDEVVQPGNRFAVRLPQGECTYDMRWVMEGGQSQERRGVNACQIENFVAR
ncbi:hypothetical protein JYK14_02195 [Siccirubricoccus sp. KC 17139]|uniref:Uncharacterized protein n=1 Tax=Siccirubricoccus soli TaxID=2899147 RepID=A0ABT1CZ85_9PROT|nr:hypothetical protein [Siccirubricoccus soli]MCO6414988.1 hypothetical protein [Siccirubricoccus soli]MCP2681119.1 hypothetical protein [Siccirubricoccus soli]